MSGVAGDVLNEAREILARDYGADGAGQDVIEKQGRDRKLGERAAHRLLDYAIDATAGKHAARLDIERAHSIAEQHDREDEPGSALADDFLGIASGVISGGGQI